MSSQAYREAGVDIEAGERAVAGMASAVRSTFTPRVLSDIGSFGGLFSAADLESDPVLVASTDGVGTKVMVAAAMDRWDSVGQDLVNHCVNDILVQGARPLFFLDFIGCSRLDPERVQQVVEGIAAACRAVGCALLGGETAEMGDVYRPGELEVVGTIVGVVSRPQLIDGRSARAGDVLLGLPSSGLHTNGYTLARRVLSELDWKAEHPALGTTPGDALLAVHRCYLGEVTRLREAGVELSALAHVTGGGIPGNLKRVLPDGLGARISLAAVPAPPIFALLERTGGLAFDDMVSAFNLGVGLILALRSEQALQARSLVPELFELGVLTEGGGVEVAR